jgi:hypothetical protein
MYIKWHFDKMSQKCQTKSVSMKNFFSRKKNDCFTVSVKLYQELHRMLNDKHNNEEHSQNHFCRRKTISITYFECVCVALVNQHKHRIISSSVARVPASYFFTLSRKRHVFWKKKDYT